jgi:hypothetical protein
MVGITLKSEISPSTCRTARRRTKTIRFDLSYNDDEDLTKSVLRLSNKEMKALWWSKEETALMKERADSQTPLFLCQADAFVATNFAFLSDVPIVSVDSVRMILAKSVLDNSDIEILRKILLTRLETSEKRQCELCQKAQQRMHGVRRVIQVQKFLNQQHERPGRKAELMRIASVYHSESSTSLAKLIGEVDAMAASNVYQTHVSV